VTTATPYSSPPPAPPQNATGGLIALGVISIIYSVLLRLCCGITTFMGSLFMLFFASDAMQGLMNMPEMEGMPDFETMMSGSMASYNLIKGFVLLILGAAMLAGGIGLIKRQLWGRSLSLGVAGAEIAWAIIDFGISVFLIYPSMAQTMGEEYAQGSQMIGNVVVGIFFTFAKLVYPVALLICLNLASIKEQFGIAPYQSQAPYQSY